MNDYIPGFVQGITRVIISHPFDYVRIHLQTNKVSSIKDFFNNNTIFSIYRGVQFPLCSVPIERSIQFKIYEMLNKHNVSPFLSGGICGLVTISFTLPSSYIANNYVLYKNNFSTLFNKIIHNKHNISSLIYSGLKPEIIRTVSASSIYFGSYGVLRNKYGNDGYQSAINGAISGWCVWTITYPLETLKIEQQINSTNTPLIQIIKNRIKTYGLFNFWKGILPIYIRTIPSSFFGMYAYEITRKLINKQNKD